MGDIDEFQIEYKRHARAKGMKLRYDAERDKAIVTMPVRSREKDAAKFAQKNIPWLVKQRKLSPDRKFLYPGHIIPFRGIDHLIIHNPDNSGRVAIAQGEIIVGGPIEGLPVRLENYLKKQARLTIGPIAGEMARDIEKKIRRIQIRDTKSRWGSCSSSGTLSFSWRLIMTPPEILEYVVAHEVAHLREMNHSRAFWQAVERLVDNAKISRKWLKNEGQQLMLILAQNPY